MLTIILVALALAIAAFLIYVATRPNSFRVTRSMTIHAPAERIFPLVNDLRAHRQWSPFDADDAMKRAYTASTIGSGAALDFDGGNKTGAGRLAIIDAAPPSRIVMMLDMVKPFTAHNTVEFDLVPNGSGTDVRWTMHGPQPFMAKLIGAVINCDKMVGTQFQTGLTKLKSVAEG